MASERLELVVRVVVGCVTEVVECRELVLGEIGDEVVVLLQGSVMVSIVTNVVMAVEVPLSLIGHRLRCETPVFYLSSLPSVAVSSV